jgi:hypothetical protein
VPLTAPSAPPSATPVSAPAPPGAPATARPTNTPPPTATRTTQPNPTSQPLPTSTTRPTSAPTSPPGTATAVPSPTSTPEPPQPALSFASASYTLSEASGEATIELRLSDAYFRPVTVSYASGGGSATPNSDYKPVGGSLTFSPGEVTKSFKVTALADELNEPSESFAISLSGVTNASVGEPQLATVIITDSDAPPVVRFAGSTRVVAESVGSLAVTIELSEPSAINVSVPFVIRGTAGLGDHDLRAGSAIISAGAASVRVRFAVADDRIDERDETLSIYLGTPANAQLGAPSVYTVKVTDDDTADLVVGAESLVLSEAPGAADHRRTYGVRLDSQPTAPVTVTLAPNAQATVSPAELVFTAANWSVPQVVTVTAVDDAIDEDGDGNQGRHEGAVAYTVASTDPNYNRFVVAELQLRITDNDTAGLQVSPASLALSEVPTATNHLLTYSVRLDSEPTAPVTVALAPDAQATASPVELVFTAANWSVPQVVTVTAVDDAIDEAAVHAGLLRHAVASADDIYDGFTVADLALSIADDDTAGVRIEPLTVALAEGGTITYTVQLESEPTAPVTIAPSEVLPSEPPLNGRPQLTALTPALTFTAANWGVPQIVTVTAVDDAIDETEPHTSTVRHAATSGDGNYAGIPVDSVSVAITDNDEAGVLIAPTALTVTEGLTITYTVALTSEPIGDVTIELTGTAGISLEPASVIFDDYSWDEPQTVTIIAADNFVNALNPSTAVWHTVTSYDANYEGLPVTPLGVTITDDDTARVVLSAANLTLSEVPTATNHLQTYTVRLNSQPAATVIITPTFDTGQLTVTAPLAPLTFTPVNWSETQTVTLQAVDDALAETRPHTVTITHALASSDPIYAALTVDPVAVSIIDDDEAGIDITPASLSLSESLTGTHATTATLYVSLRSEPTAPVTVSLTPDAQLTVDVITLVFDSGNYSVTQAITLTVVDDFIDETELHTATLTLSAHSDDPSYSQASGSYEVPLEDDDTALVAIGQAAPLNEGNGGLRSLRFPVTLSRPAAVPVNVSYETFDLSALGGTDFQAVTAMLTFAAGELSANIVVYVVGDVEYEIDEQFGVRLTAVGPVGALDAVNVEAIGTILNDDVGVAIATEAGGAAHPLAGPGRPRG